MKLLLRTSTLVLMVCLCLSVISTQAEMIVHYSFDDGTATDLTDNDLDGTLVGTAVIVDDAVRGSKVLELDGVDLGANSSSVTINDPTSMLDLSTPGEATVAAWVHVDRPIGTYPHSSIFSQGKWTEGVYLGVRADGQPNGVLVNGGPKIVSSTVPVPRGAWVHVAVTMSGNTSTFYIGGNPRGVDVDRTGPVRAPAELSIIGLDQRLENRWFFDGRIDDFRIYDEALSEAEIKAIVPEPSTLVLLAVGALALIWRRR